MKKKQFVIIYLIAINFNLSPVFASIEYSGNVKQSQKNYLSLKKVICRGEKGYCDLSRVRVIGNWAWVIWGLEEAGGSSVLKYSGGNWKIVTGGGGALGIQDAINAGVPKSIAEMLVPSFGLYIGDTQDKISESDLETYSEWDLMIARNSIFARHGRIFKYKPLQDYFMTWPWYRPDPNYHDGMLSEIEKYNANVILQVEKSKGYM